MNIFKIPNPPPQKRAACPAGSVGDDFMEELSNMWGWPKKMFPKNISEWFGIGKQPLKWMSNHTFQKSAFSGRLDIKSLAVWLGPATLVVCQRRHLQLWRRQTEVDLLSYLEVGKSGRMDDSIFLVDGGCGLWDFTWFYHIPYLLSSWNESGTHFFAKSIL